ncbi:E3 ubiquitin-protein ligase [Nymphaea thermarum]|nr:E3 ubiquitin-protein ligase [Nymphaea thermarum]
MSDNIIRGAIPSTVFCNMFDMQSLYVIPDCLTNLTMLSILNLRENQLHGEIPRGIVCGRHISGAVELRGNRLTGFDQLDELDLSNNQLYGPIPGDFGLSCATSLRVLSLNDNKLVGKIPRSLSNCSRLEIINLGKNQFTGGIPEEIGELKGLYLLNMSSNSLDGPIPRFLGNLENIEALNLSHNHLSGSIPEELTNDTFLCVLDLSHNNLQWRIPQGKQSNTFDATSFDGNRGLCGPPLGISCPINGPPPVISQSCGGNGSQDSINSIKEKARNSYWEYAAVEFGFVLGVSTIILPILFIERLRSWYKNCVDKAVEVLIFLPYHCSISSGA